MSEMDGNITAFQHDEFGSVRSVVIDGKPWLVLADVAQVLGYGHGPHAKKHLRGSQLTVPNRDTGRELGFRDGTMPTLITEGGLYRLMMRSRAEHAERFQLWVEDEVLPQIRRTGGYSSTREVPQSYSAALRAAADAADRAEAAEHQAAELSAELSEAAPKADKWEAYMNANGLIGMTDLAKVLGVSVQKMTKMLVDKKVFFTQDRPEGKRRIPYKKYEDNGMFRVKTEVHNGHQCVVVYAAPSGADHAMDLSRNPLARI